MNRALHISSRRHVEHGFTLVELLVVVSIVALLVSILLPSLRSARDQAKQVKCFANLHAIHLALVCYADDNRQELPSYTTMGGWGFRVAPGKRFPTSSPYPEVYGVQAVLNSGCAPRINPHSGVAFLRTTDRPIYLASDSEVWTCPANPGPKDRDHEWKDYGNTYYYRTNSGTKSDFSQPDDPDWTASPKKNYNIDWLNKNSRIGALSLLMMDNFHKYPIPSGMGRPGQDSDYNVRGKNPNMRQPPHRVSIRKNSPSQTWCATYADGHVQMNAFNH